MELEIDDSRISGAAALSKRTLARGLDLILDTLAMQDSRLVLQLTGDRGISGLNNSFLGLCGPTNVLSFPEQTETGGRCLGQICLSVETLLREARLYGQDPAEHLYRLLAHGILHLAGYEHGFLMQELTEQALETIQDWPERELVLVGP
ncbi:MAG: rRNA maturation RNase YbeY [Desulfohalobiaceae bacterium]|nr:rRNA maturation RNase YbeY [Desulfohalobiaceae bacterium]